MKSILSAVVLIFAVSQVRAESGGLMELYYAAQQNDPVFGAAQASLSAGLESGNIGLSGLLPAVQGSLAYSSVSQDITSFNASKGYSYSPRIAAINISQPIFDLEKFKDYSIGQLQVGQSQAIFAEERQSLALRVSQAYFDLLLAGDNYELAVAEKKALEAQAEQSRSLFQGGVATVTDMEESKARYQVAEAQMFVMENAREVSRKRLEKIVGKLPDDMRLGGIYDFDPIPPNPSNLESWKASSNTRNLKVLSANINLQLAMLQVEKTGARHYPTAQLTASYQNATDPQVNYDKSNSSRIGVEVILPLYQGGRTSAEFRKAQQLQEKARNELEAEVRESEIGATEAFLGVVGGLSRIHALEQAVKSSVVVVRGMEIGQRNGLRTNTDVLTAQQQLFSAKRDLQKERYGYLLSMLKLKASIGGLSEEELAFVDALVGVGVQQSKSLGLHMDRSIRALAGS